MYVHSAVFVCLKLLFNSMLLHGIISLGFGQSVITPVIKCKNKGLTDINNYRPVRIIPNVSEIFESYVSYLFSGKLSNHHNQFGFVKEGSCSRALFVFNSVVKYFRLKENSIFL